MRWKAVHNKSYYELDLREYYIAQMFELARSYFPNECGGLMFGSYVRNNTVAWVKQLINKTKDNCPRCFEWDPEIWKDNDRIWEESSGTEYIVGTWHTHPNLPPHPSLKDDIVVFKEVKKDYQSVEIVIGNTFESMDDLNVYLYIAPDIKIKMEEIIDGKETVNQERM